MTNTLAVINGNNEIQVPITIQTADGGIILGNISGNARGAGSIDIQSSRSNPAQVASSTGSVALGQNNTSSSWYTTALGYGNTASNFLASAIGYSNTATQMSAFSAGNGNQATGTQAVAMGSNQNVSGNNSFAFGFANVVSAAGAGAFGFSLVTNTAGTLDFGMTNGTKMTLNNSGTLQTRGGKVNKTRRVTTTATILVSDDVIFANTDSAGYTVTLPVGVEGQSFKIINSGSSGNTLTIAPNGAQHLLGVNASTTLTSGQTIFLTYNATDGWY